MARSPLAPRHGLQSAWVRTEPDERFARMAEFLHARLTKLAPGEVAHKLATGGFVFASGDPVDERTPYRPHQMVYFHRDLRHEPEVPGTLDVLYRDERILVVDKPHFLATIPRGRHVVQSVVVRARAQFGLPELSPAHRLDRGTAGVLVLVTERTWRPAYQQMFEHRVPRKVYEAVAAAPGDLILPTVVETHLVKTHGVLQVEQRLDLPPNARSEVRLLRESGDRALYEVTPVTGRTHQVRAHMWHLGRPILNDPLYPTFQDVDVDDFSHPLQLLARELAFVDPVDGTERRYRSARELSAAVRR